LIAQFSKTVPSLRFALCNIFIATAVKIIKLLINQCNNIIIGIKRLKYKKLSVAQPVILYVDKKSQKFPLGTDQ
jgi:hypothetical protein